MRDVLVLLGTYNGEKYLEEQLQSIYGQSYEGISVLVRDDGSKDGTLDILEKYHVEKDLNYHKGENVGAFPNFYKLIKMAPKSDYYAYCDQDDIWKKEKIEIAVEKLKGYDELPAMYFCNNTIIDKKKMEITGTKKKNFSNANNLHLATVRNICQGCTCVFNHKLMELLKVTSDSNTFPHDWWSYVVCLSVGGVVIADSNSYLLYRQHENNVIGDCNTLLFRFKRRVKEIFIKRQYDRSRMCCKVLDIYNDYILEDNKEVLGMVANYRKSFWLWIKMIFCKGFYTNELEYSISYFIAIVTRII